LLETMAAGAPVIAHDNPYNRWVLAGNAAFFSSPDQLAEIIRNWDERNPGSDARITSNVERIRKDFQWDRVTDRYETLFEGLMKSKR
jgi:glycosyltransferase involved in cell wall biosynthesis